MNIEQIRTFRDRQGVTRPIDTMEFWLAEIAEQLALQNAIALVELGLEEIRPEVLTGKRPRVESIAPGLAAADRAKNTVSRDRWAVMHPRDERAGLKSFADFEQAAELLSTLGPDWRIVDLDGTDGLAYYAWNEAAGRAVPDNEAIGA